MVRSKDLMKWAPQQYFASATDVPRDICPVHKLIQDSITIDGKTEYGFRQPVEMGVNWPEAELPPYSLTIVRL